MVKPKRQTVCPGCGLPKTSHEFGAPNKNCDGPPDEPPSADLEVKKEDLALTALVTAVRELSMQVAGIKKEQDEIKAAASAHPSASRGSTADVPAAQHNVQIIPELTTASSVPLESATPLAGILPEKYLKAMRRGEYIDLSDLYSFFACQMSDSHTGGNIGPVSQPKHQHTIDNFDDWLVEQI